MYDYETEHEHEKTLLWGGLPTTPRKRPLGLTVTVLCHYIPSSGKLNSCNGSDSHWANRSSTSVRRWWSRAQR